MQGHTSLKSQQLRTMTWHIPFENYNKLNFTDAVYEISLLNSICDCNSSDQATYPNIAMRKNTMLMLRLLHTSRRLQEFLV